MKAVTSILALLCLILLAPVASKRYWVGKSPKCWTGQRRVWKVGAKPKTVEGKAKPENCPSGSEFEVQLSRFQNRFCR